MRRALRHALRPVAGGVTMVVAHPVHEHAHRHHHRVREGHEERVAGLQGRAVEHEDHDADVRAVVAVVGDEGVEDEPQLDRGRGPEERHLVVHGADVTRDLDVEEHAPDGDGYAHDEHHGEEDRVLQRRSIVGVPRPHEIERENQERVEAAAQRNDREDRRVLRAQHLPEERVLERPHGLAHLVDVPQQRGLHEHRLKAVDLVHVALLDLLRDELRRRRVVGSVAVKVAVPLPPLVGLRRHAERC
mmetsp:Transcript_18398/g.56190  ORF Transcript_18398/g.56190 Transcript_18398/m.56190 type:complete len:245 (-) Transcript_18398:973-1707(-)